MCNAHALVFAFAATVLFLSAFEALKAIAIVYMPITCMICVRKLNKSYERVREQIG